MRVGSPYSSQTQNVTRHFAVRVLSGTFIILGVALFIYTISMYHSAEQLSLHKATVTGHITQKYTKPRGNEGDIDDDLIYSFQATNGQTYSGLTIVPTDTYNMTKVGSSTQIVYNAQIPTKNYISGYQPTTASAKVFRIISLVMILAPAFTIILTFIF